MLFLSENLTPNSRSKSDGKTYAFSTTWDYYVNYINGVKTDKDEVRTIKIDVAAFWKWVNKILNTIKRSV